MWITQSTQPVAIRRKWSLTVGVVLASFFLVLSSFLAGGTGSAQITFADIPYTEELIQLEQNYDSILDTTESKRCLAYTDKDKTVCDLYEDTVLYLYKTDITPTENVINKNTVQISDNTFKIYGSDTFYQDDKINTWKQTEFGVIEKGDFTAVQEDRLKSIDTILKLNNPFHVYSVNAQTYSQSNSASMYCYNGSRSFADCRFGLTTADYFSDSATAISCNSRKPSADYLAWAGFLSFDTSALDGTVSSSSLYIYGITKDDNNFNPTFIKGTYTTPLDNTDWNDVTISTTTDILDATTFNLSGYNRFTISDLAVVDTTGTTKMVLTSDKMLWNVAPTASTNSCVTGYTGLETGTDKDPYLLVTLEAAAPSCGDAECNGTETCSDCPEDCGACAGTSTPPADLTDLPALPLVDDLTVITGRTDHYESTTTAPDWVEYHYYRIPFFLWYILYTAFGFILGFLLVEVKRILKKKRGNT